MPQIFHRSSNTLARVSLFAAIVAVGGILFAADQIWRSPYFTQVGVPRPQPVPFSHAHHVGGIGIDCRYCHTSVEQSDFAGIPPTQTCMNCHARIWSDSPTLEPVRESFRTDTSIVWNRVHDVAEFVYFPHRVHIAKGVACVTCHGRIDKMALTWKTQSMRMEWCLGCHRNPEQYVVPKEHVFDMDWTPPDDRVALGRRLVKEYNIRTRTDCSTCHR